MEKDALGAPRSAACYRAYEGLKSANNGNTSSLKRPPSHATAAAAIAGMDHAAAGGGAANHPDGYPKSAGKNSSQVRCLCFGGVPDKASRHSFLKGFLINLAICAILVLYTLLGSFIFLYIEGSAAELPLQQRSLATTIPAGPAYSSTRRNATWINQINEARVRTVESLWLTTEKLNILYRDNWTRLATEEIIRFQEQVVRTLTDNLGPTSAHSSVTHSLNDDVTGRRIVNYEWNFARAFLYSLTVLTTIGYGSIAPRSALGKLVTMGYAFVGIPLTLVYLSSAGGLLSRCARGVFTRALCCCLCSNCGYCCYDERRMQEKERRMRKRRQQEEMAQQQQQLQLQEPFYVRANASTYPSSLEIKCSPKDEVSSLSSGDRPNVTILAPISICLGAMLCYIVAGAFTLHKLEGWDFIDASYFCFMSLSTIGFGDIVPGSYPSFSALEARNATVWFCSCYIMSGMALTAMCFNILHDEIVHRLAHQADKQAAASGAGGGAGHEHGAHGPHHHHHHHGQLLKPSSSLDEMSAPACHDPFAMAS